MPQPGGLGTRPGHGLKSSAGTRGDHADIAADLAHEESLSEAAGRLLRARPMVTRDEAMGLGHLHHPLARLDVAGVVAGREAGLQAKGERKVAASEWAESVGLSPGMRLGSLS